MDGDLDGVDEKSRALVAGVMGNAPPAPSPVKESRCGPVLNPPDDLALDCAFIAANAAECLEAAYLDAAIIIVFDLVTLGVNLQWEDAGLVILNAERIPERLLADMRSLSHFIKEISRCAKFVGGSDLCGSCRRAKRFHAPCVPYACESLKNSGRECPYCGLSENDHTRFREVSYLGGFSTWCKTANLR